MERSIRVKSDYLAMTQHFAMMQKFRIENTFCDVTLKVGVVCFPAHRVLLTAAIPQFYLALKHNAKVITIKEIDAPTLSTILDFVYGEEVNVGKLNVKKLLIGSSFLLLDKLRNSCVEFLMSTLNPKASISIKHLAESVSCKTLVSAAYEYIISNFEAAASSEDFLYLELEELVHLLKEDDLEVDSEENVFKAAISWLNHSESRVLLLPDVLEHIRWPLLSPRFFHKVVSKENCIKKSVIWADLLEEISAFHLIPECRDQMKSFKVQHRKYKTNLSQIYVFGGMNDDEDALNSVEIYHSVTNNWEAKKSMPTAKRAFSTVVLDNKLYTFGGIRENKAISDVDVYDPKVNEWSKVNDMLGRRCSAGVAVLNDCAYLCGGYLNGKVLNTVESYCPLSGNWVTLKPLECCRYQPGCVALDGFLYVLGGASQNNLSLKIAAKYDPLNDDWTNIKSMLANRKCFGAVAWQGNIYACGGVGCTGEVLQSVEVYSPCTNTWEFLAPMNYKRYGLVLTVFMEKLWALGGYDDKSVEEYDFSKNTWSIIQSMNIKRKFFGAAVLPKKFEL